MVSYARMKLMNVGCGRSLLHVKLENSSQINLKEFNQNREAYALNGEYLLNI